MRHASTNAEETKGLLTTQVPWRGHKRRYVIGMVFSLVILLLLVCLLASPYFGCVQSTTCFTTVKEIHLRDVLPNSFGVKFTVKQQDNSNGFKKESDTTITWEVQPNNITYQENRKEVMHGEPMHLKLVIVNNRPVVEYQLQNKTSWTCADDPASFEWFSILQQVIMMTSVLSSVTEDKCPGQVWRTQYLGQPISVCLTKEDSEIIYIEYGNIIAERRMWTIPSPSSIRLPPNDLVCNYNTILPPTTDNIGSSLSEFEQKANDNPDAVRTGGTKPICLFVHGIGVQWHNTGYRVLTRMDYWGNIEKYTTQCSSHRFIQFNTVERGWDDQELHRMFCEFATNTTTRGGMISNKLLFTHSMGNNIVAAAFHNKTCSLDRTSSRWFSVSAPWNGSKVADKLQYLCSKYIGYKHGHISPEIVFNVLKLTKYCTLNGKPAPAFSTMKTTYKSKTGVSYSDLIAVAKTSVSGALCGTAPWGIGQSWMFSGTFEFTQYISKLKTPNDGIVAYDSCDVFGGETFQPSYKSKFYRGNINHLESATKFGCSMGQTCLWYRSL